jgi:hypothetical protein
MSNTHLADDFDDSEGPAATALSAEQLVNIAALKAAVAMGGGRLEAVLRRAAYMRDWINGADYADLHVPSEL